MRVPKEALLNNRPRKSTKASYATAGSTMPVMDSPSERAQVTSKCLPHFLQSLL